jgi:hypothetical protein
MASPTQAITRDVLKFVIWSGTNRLRICGLKQRHFSSNPALEIPYISLPENPNIASSISRPTYTVFEDNINQTRRRVQNRMLVKIKDKLVNDRPRADDFLDGAGDGTYGVEEGDVVVEESVEVVVDDGAVVLLLSPTAVCTRPGGIPPSTMSH